MKRILIFLFSLVLAGSVAYGYVQQKSIGMDIKAYNGLYHNFIIEPITGVPSDPVGMPFYLTADDVQYNSLSTSTAGREIAQWSVHSNATPITIQITADPLKLVDTSTPTGFNKNAQTIDYILFFPYVYENADGAEVTGFMKVQSGTPYNSKEAKNAISDTLVDENGVKYGINTGTFPVRFMLTQTSSQNINDRSKYPAGDYRATVTIVNSGS